MSMCRVRHIIVGAKQRPSFPGHRYPNRIIRHVPQPSSLSHSLISLLFWIDLQEPRCCLWAIPRVPFVFQGITKWWIIRLLLGISVILCPGSHGALPGAGILHIECILHIAYWVQHFPQHHLSGSGIAHWNSNTAGSQCEEFCPWQRSWGRRLGIRKGGMEPQGSPWKFLSIYTQNQSLPTFCFVLSPTPLTLWGVSPTTSLKKELAYSSS